jgi:hypothetical protein
MKNFESISILWGARSEDLEIVSEKIFNSLHYIGNRIPHVFHKWYELGYSKEESIKKNVFIDIENLKEILDNNTDRKYPNLGTRISLWNGATNAENEASFSAKLNSNSPKVKNNFVLRFPKINRVDIVEIVAIIDFLFATFNGESIRINGEEVSHNNIERMKEIDKEKSIGITKKEKYNQVPPKDHQPGTNWSLLDDES